MQPNRLPRITVANVVNAIAIGAVTVPQLARVFGVPPTSPRLLRIVRSLVSDRRVEVSVGDLHLLSLSGGPR